MENTLQKFRTENKEKLDECLRFLAEYSGFNEVGDGIESTKFEGDIADDSTFSIRYNDGTMIWVCMSPVNPERAEEIQEATE